MNTSLRWWTSHGLLRDFPLNSQLPGPGSNHKHSKLRRWKRNRLNPLPPRKKKEIHQVTIGIGWKGGASPLNQSKGQGQSRITLDAPWKTEIEPENIFARWVNLEFFGLEREEF